MNPLGLSVGAGVGIAALFHIVKMTHQRNELERRQMMADHIQGQRSASMETMARRQNLDRMRTQTQAQFGMDLMQRGMINNPMLANSGASAAPFIAWSARRG